MHFIHKESNGRCIHRAWSQSDVSTPHSYLCPTHDVLKRKKRLIHTFDNKRYDLYVIHAIMICVTCLLYMCDMPHSYVRHDVVIRATCLIRMPYSGIRMRHVARMTTDNTAHESYIIRHTNRMPY